MTEPEALVLKRVIRAPRTELFRACTDPTRLRLWLAPGCNIVERVTTDLRVGGDFHLEARSPDGTLHRISGTYRAIEPDHRIVQTWIYHGPLDLLTDEETLLEIVLEPRGDATELTLTHRRLRDERVREAYRCDWPTCFDKLERALN